LPPTTVSTTVSTTISTTVYLNGYVGQQEPVPYPTTNFSRPVQTLAASTVTVNSSVYVTQPGSTDVVTIAGQETCAPEATAYITAYDTSATTVYETADASTVTVLETIVPDAVTQVQTQVQQETVYITAGRSYTNTYSGKTIQPSTVIQTITITPPPETVTQSADTVSVTVPGPTTYISQPGL